MSKGMGLGSVVPEVSKVRSIGKSVFVGGALGGFFDDPVNKQSTQSIQSFPSLQSSHNIIRVSSSGQSQNSGLSSFE